jgi:hypothetical protein
MNKQNIPQFIWVQWNSNWTMDTESRPKTSCCIVILTPAKVCISCSKLIQKNALSRNRSGEILVISFSISWENANVHVICYLWNCYTSRQYFNHIKCASKTNWSLIINGFHPFLSLKPVNWWHLDILHRTYLSTVLELLRFLPGP